jgi:GT2 family glycosyltransferase
VIVNYRRPDLVGTCVESLRIACLGASFRVDVLVVDNGSGDGSVDTIRTAYPDVRLLALDGNRPLPEAMNVGWRETAGEWVLLLNNDVTVQRGVLEELLRVTATAPDVGAISTQMRFDDRPELINSAGIAVDRLGVPFDRLFGAPIAADAGHPVEVFGACGGAGCYRRTMLEALGGFDESLGFGFEDVDLAWRAQMNGWRAIHAPAAVVYHRHGGTVPPGSPFRYYQAGVNRVRILAKHADGRHLARYAAGMVLYDAAYVVYVAAKDRTLAPLRGRLHGMREWRTYRRSGAPGRRPVPLAPVQGPGAALRRRATRVTKAGGR